MKWNVGAPLAVLLSQAMVSGNDNQVGVTLHQTAATTTDTRHF
jgi:hypothetical protein